MQQTDSQRDVAPRFIELASDVEIAMLTTVAADGRLHSRPMLTLKPITIRELWFFTRADSAKAEEVERENEVAVTYSSPVRFRYVAVSGRASVRRDVRKAREVWTPIAALWFPGGPEDDQLRLLRVEPRVIEYWDAEEKRMKILFDVARAAFGERVDTPASAHQRLFL